MLPSTTDPNCKYYQAGETLYRQEECECCWAVWYSLHGDWFPIYPDSLPTLGSLIPIELVWVPEREWRPSWWFGPATV